MESKIRQDFPSFGKDGKRVARKIGDVQARYPDSLLYLHRWTLRTGIRWFGDPLAIKDGARKGWCLKTSNEPVSLERASQQF